MLQKYQVYDSILAYLVENPEARDTVEGIAQWWLLEQEIRFYLHEIETALDKLVSGGLLLKLGAIYRLDHNKMDEIRALLEESRYEGTEASK